MLFYFKTLTVVAVLFSSSASLAYQGAISGATGQTGRAAAEATDSMFLNPAGIAELRGYYFTSTFSAGSFESGVAQKQYSLALMDNMKETVVPTAFGFNETVRARNGREDVRKRFQISVGQFATPSLSFGLGLSYQNDFFVERYQQTNLTLGGLWALNKKAGIALVFEDMIPQDESLPVEVRQRSRTGLGFVYLHDTVVRFRGDLISSENNSFNRPTAAFGVESFLTKWVITRIGTQRDMEKDANLYTGGVGFIGPRFAANYAYMIESRDNQSRHAVDLTIPLW